MVPQDFPLPLPARPIVFGKRKRHYFCDHHLSLVADRDKSGFVLFCTAHHIARTKCTLTILDSLFSAVSSNFVGSLDDGNKSRIISYRDQKKGQIPSRIMLRLSGMGSDTTLDNAHVAEDYLARTTTTYRIIAVGRTCSVP